jgi:hypothetical protein
MADQRAVRFQFGPDDAAVYVPPTRQGVRNLDLLGPKKLRNRRADNGGEPRVIDRTVPQHLRLDPR